MKKKFVIFVVIYCITSLCFANYEYLTKRSDLLKALKTRLTQQLNQEENMPKTLRIQKLLQITDKELTQLKEMISKVQKAKGTIKVMNIHFRYFNTNTKQRLCGNILTQQ